MSLPHQSTVGNVSVQNFTKMQVLAAKFEVESQLCDAKSTMQSLEKEGQRLRKELADALQQVFVMLISRYRSILGWCCCFRTGIVCSRTSNAGVVIGAVEGQN